MIPKATDINRGEWKRDTQAPYIKYELRIKGTGILIGEAHKNFDDATLLHVSARLSNVGSGWTTIPITTDVDLITKAWESVVDKSLLPKLFK